MGKDSLSATQKAAGKEAKPFLPKGQRNKAVRTNYKIVRRDRMKVGKSSTLERGRSD